MNIKCVNPACKVATIAKTYNGFPNYYCRMTKRCDTFISLPASEISYEGCTRICKETDIRTSWGSVIHLLIKRYEQQSPVECGSVIGTDDFAYKKKHIRYDHRKAITSDRTSAYAKVISEELPDIMQIADRFHLHQNLLDALKGVLNLQLPFDMMKEVSTAGSIRILVEEPAFGNCSFGA